MFQKTFLAVRGALAVLEVHFPLIAVDVLIGICDVQEEIFFVMFLMDEKMKKVFFRFCKIAICKFFVYLVKIAHGGAGGWNHIVDEEEQSVFRTQVDTLANEKVELADGQV